jgi:hypothetical protein
LGAAAALEEAATTLREAAAAFVGAMGGLAAMWAVWGTTAADGRARGGEGRPDARGGSYGWPGERRRRGRTRCLEDGRRRRCAWRGRAGAAEMARRRGGVAARRRLEAAAARGDREGGGAARKKGRK